MATKKSKIEETIEKEVQKALDSGLIDMFVGDKSKIDFLESKLDKLSGQLTEEVGHTDLSSTTNLIDLVAESMIAKMSSSESDIFATTLKASIEKLVSEAAQEMKESE
jgi:hypothetical protein